MSNIINDLKLKKMVM